MPSQKPDDYTTLHDYLAATTSYASDVLHGYPTTSSKVVVRALYRAYAADPIAAATIDQQTGTSLQDSMSHNWNLCLTGKQPSLGNDLDRNKLTGCEQLIRLLWQGYEVNLDKSFLDAIKDVLYFAETTLSPHFQKQLLSDNGVGSQPAQSHGP